MRMMRKRDAATQEDGFHWLLARAREILPELIIEFRKERDHGLRCWLLELIGEAHDPRAFELLVEYLHCEDELLRDWAITGLNALNTREARKALFEAGAV